MKEKLTTYERHESIKFLLVKGKSTTTRHFVNLFGVTKQTILNDIVFLSSRLPITTKAGNGGGIFLDLEYDYPKVYLTKDEENLLLSLLDFLCEKDKKILVNIINKFSMPAVKDT